MKQFIITILFNSVIFCAFSQVDMTAKWPQFEIDTISSGNKAIEMDVGTSGKIPTKDKLLNIRGAYNITNVEVSRNPVEVVITNDNQFAFVRCFLSNTVEVISIPSGEVVKSFSIPSPKDLLLSKSGNELFVASLRDEPCPPNPPPDDCNIFVIPLSGQSILTTISIPSQEIIKIDTIKTFSIKRILESRKDSILYLQGKEVIEYDLSNSTILRQWPISEQINHSKIDNKNKRIFLTTVDSTGKFFLKVIDLLTGDIITSQFYTNGEIAVANYIGMDTLSNRVFVQGKYQPNSEVLVFDAISLNQLPPIAGAILARDSFIACPDLESIFIGAGYPNNILELDYSTLQPKQILPFPLYTHYHTLFLNIDKSRLFSFQYGSSGGLSYLNPPQYLDVVEYDIQTGNFWQYSTTENKYECSYARSLAITGNGNYLIATNSPENTVSIIEIPHSAVNEYTSKNSISVFPNPTSGILNVSFQKQSNEDYTIEIYNNIGSLVYKTLRIKSKTNFTIDLTKYPKGQYYLHVKSNEQSSFIKIIKI